MKNTAVIYKSTYGTTKQYAQWIAEDLGADLFESNAISPADLQKYDTVIYGGGLYAGKIIGVDLVVKKPVNNLIIFTVSLANPETTDYTEILEKNIPAKMRENIKVFHLRGGIDYKKLGLGHRAMMAMMKKMTIDKRSQNELTDDDKVFLDTYGNQVNFTKRITINPLIEYVKNIL